MKTYIKLSVIAVLLIIFFILLNLSNFTPASPLYLYQVKRGQEKIFLSLKSSPDEKAAYQSYLLNQRLKELQIMTGKKEYGFILPSALRYSSTAGQMTDIIVNNSLKGMVEGALKQFNQHKEALQNIYAVYPADDTEGKYILDDINYLNLYSDKLKVL